jgi:hypothetical protein
MDEKTRLMYKHSKVLKGTDRGYTKEDYDEILKVFKDVNIVRIYNGSHNFRTCEELIHTINILFQYDVDVYQELLDYFIDNYLVTLQCNHKTLMSIIQPIEDDIKNTISLGLYEYIFKDDSTNLTPEDVFLSPHLLKKCYRLFSHEDFTPGVITKGITTYKGDYVKELFHIIERMGVPIICEDLIKKTIRNDNVAVLDYLHVNYEKLDTSHLNICVSHGSIGCIIYLHEKGIPWPHSSDEYFRGELGRHLNCLMYAHKNGCIVDKNSCILDGKCNMESLIYVHKNGFPWDERTSYALADNGNLECLIYTHKNGCPWDRRTCSWAAENGHLDCLKYAHDNGCPWDENTTYRAAVNGHLDCLKYVHDNGCPWDEEYTCAMVAQGGHLECLKYAHENECPWDEDTCAEAARGGHLDCLKYAHENECPWNEDTSAEAARDGHLDCLKYAHENGCPWDEDTCSNAARNGHLDCLKYAHENECPRDKDTHEND